MRDMFEGNERRGEPRNDEGHLRFHASGLPGPAPLVLSIV